MLRGWLDEWWILGSKGPWQVSRDWGVALLMMPIWGPFLSFLYRTSASGLAVWCSEPERQQNSSICCRSVSLCPPLLVIISGVAVKTFVTAFRRRARETTIQQRRYRSHEKSSTTTYSASEVFRSTWLLYGKIIHDELGLTISKEQIWNDEELGVLTNSHVFVHRMDRNRRRVETVGRW